MIVGRINPAIAIFGKESYKQFDEFRIHFFSNMYI